MNAFTRPVHIRPDGTASLPERILLGTGASAGQYTERWLQEILFAYPQTLPINEIDPHAGTLVPVCMEMQTGAGPADILYVTRTGQLVLVETKLWRNAEARRVVVAQILDYAKELSGWSYEDLARETALASKGGPGYLLERVRAVHPDVDEASFVDGINRSLAAGDFILIIAGDGIRSGAEAMVSFLERYGHLRFHFALIEVASYLLADGARLLQPRVLAKTELLRRSVYVAAHGGVAVPIEDAADPVPMDAQKSAEGGAAGDGWERFWAAYLARLRLDDTQQAPPARPPRGPALFVPLLPGRQFAAWITVYVMQSEHHAGVFLTLGKQLAQASEWYERLAEQREAVEAVMPGLTWEAIGDGSYRIRTRRVGVAGIEEPAARDRVLDCLCTQTNGMVNAFRHRLASLDKEGSTPT